MDLKLPEIEPARVVPSAANAIDRAGAQFKQGAESVGQALLAPEMAKLQVESQEATIQRSREEKDKLDFIKRNPYVTVETAKGMFLGGEMPAGVRLTEPDGSPRLIPMSELAVAYFDQEAPGVTERAAAHISAPGWRQRFKLAAQEDSNQKRAEVVELQRNLQLADNELRTKFQYEQAMAARDFPLAETILASDVSIGEVERTKMRAAHPAKKTLAVVLDRLQSGDVKELDSLIADLTENKAKPENGIFEPVPAEQRYTIINRARDAKNDVLAAEERARKAAKEARFQAEFDKIQQAEADAIATGGLTTDRYSVTNIPLDMDDAEYRTLREAALADPARPSDPRIEIGIADMLRTPGRLGAQSPQWVMSLKPKLSQKKWEETLKAWSQDRADSSKTKPPVPEFAVRWIDDAVDYAMGGADKAKADSVGALALKAQMYTNVAARLRADPNGLEPKEVNAMAVRARSGKSVGTFGADGVPAGARAVIIYASKGGALSEPMIRAEYQKALKQKDDLRRAWVDVMGEDPETSPPFDDSALMDMHYRVTTDEAGLKARAQKRLPQGATVDARQIRYQAALEQAPAGTAEGRAKREADAEKVATQRQLVERRTRIQKIAKTLLEDSKNRPPELAAEFSRIADLVGRPKPGTSWNYTVADMKAMQESAAMDYADKMDASSHMKGTH